MKIGIVGTGYVGLVTGACLAKLGHEVLCVDSDADKVRALQAGKVPFFEPGLDALVAQTTGTGRLRFSTSTAEAVRECTAIFIAVGTPPTSTGTADLSYLEQVALDIARSLTAYRVIVEKSTVPVKTGEKVSRTIARHVKGDVPFDVASNPEFLREGSAIDDFLHPDRIVIGVTSERARRVLEEIYAPLDAPMIVTDIPSAEIIKHASNSFLALKISYINAVARVCELANANIDEVARGMGLDGRIGTRFLHAGIGYGGSCFPKDVDAFYEISQELGYEFGLIREVQEINRNQRRYFLGKIEKALWIVKDKNIGCLGLSFKPDTDDVREAPSLEILAALVERGARLKAYDPQAARSAAMHLEEVEMVSGPYEAARDADCLLVLTEWQEFRDLDLVRLRDVMRYPLLVDGRNIYELDRMRELGFEYHSIGRESVPGRTRTAGAQRET